MSRALMLAAKATVPPGMRQMADSMEWTAAKGIPAAQPVV